MRSIALAGVKKGASATEMAQALERELAPLVEHGATEAQVGQKLLSAAMHDLGNGCARTRTDTVAVCDPNDTAAKEVSAGSLLTRAGHNLLASKNRWYAVGHAMQGSFQFIDLHPHEGGLIRRLETGEITPQRAAKVLDQILHKG